MTVSSIDLPAEKRDYRPSRRGTPLNPDDALALLTTQLAAHGLSGLGWTGKLDNAVRRFGTCRYRRKQITLSRHLATINTDEETLDTVLHEIAHALAFVEHGEDCGHDERWKAIAARIGARPERTVDADEVSSVAGAFCLVHSETGEVFCSYHKRPRERDLGATWIRGRRAETEGKLVVVSARELARLQGGGDEGPDVIRSFDRMAIKELSTKLTAAIAAVCEEHGLSVEREGGRFDPESYRCGYVIRVPREQAEDGDRVEFALHAHLFELTGGDYGRRFARNGKTYTLVGFKPRNRKYPVIGRDDAGTRYKFSSDVLEALEEGRT